MIASPLMTSRASTASWVWSDRLAWRIASSTSVPIRSTASRIRLSWASNASRGAWNPARAGSSAASLTISSSWSIATDIGGVFVAHVAGPQPNRPDT